MSGELIVCGFEAQSLANDAEGAGFRATNSPTIETTGGVPHSGAACLKATGTNKGVWWQMDGTAGMGPAMLLDVEYRFTSAFKTDGTPSAASAFMRIFTQADPSTVVAASVRLNTSRVVQVLNRSGVVVGTGPTLTAGQWYVIEFRFKVVTGGGTNSPFELWMDGSQSVASTLADLGSIAAMRVACETGASSPGANYFWDDVSLIAPVFDSGTVNPSLTISGSEAVREAGTSTTTGTPAGAEAVSESGTPVVMTTFAGSEAAADSGSNVGTIAPSGTDAPADAGADSLSVTPAGSDSAGDSGTVTSTLSFAAGNEALSEQAAGQLAVAPSGTDTLNEPGSVAISFTAAAGESAADAGTGTASVSPSGSDGISDSGGSLAVVAATGLETLAEGITVYFSVGPVGPAQGPGRLEGASASSGRETRSSVHGMSEGSGMSSELEQRGRASQLLD